MKTVQQTIRAHDLLRAGDHVVLGLSGGPDSVCLFHLLQRLAHPLQLTIHPVHVNHQLRPGDAERDQAYVEQLCAQAAREEGAFRQPAGACAEVGEEGSRADAGGAHEPAADRWDATSRGGIASESGDAVRPCRSFAVDVKAMALELGLTSEEAGRRARYDAFVQVAREVGAMELSNDDAKGPDANRRGETASAPRDEAGKSSAKSGHAAPRVVIAVAQNANDQAETILQRLLRGTGPDGLSGIAYERCEREIPVIRPLLDVTRAEIEAYCEEHGLHPVRDHTNAEPIYTRNKIRLQLLPLLQEYNPSIVETLGRLARIASADRDYLQQQAAAALEPLRGEDEKWIEAAEAPEQMQADEVDIGVGTKCVETVVHDATGELQGYARSAAPSLQPLGRATAQTSLVLDRTGLAALPEAIRRRVIVMAFEEIGLVQDITEERLRAADAIIGKKQAPKTVEFPHGYRLTVARGQVRLTSKPDTVYST